MSRILTCATVLLILTYSGLVAQSPQNGERAEAVSAAKQPTSRTYKLRISFARDSLKNALELISAKIGVPIEIERHDLMLEGITQNQAFGFDDSTLTVDELIRKYLLKCNPDDKLAYVARTDRQGIATVHIVSRKGAANRGEALFPEFTLALPEKMPEIVKDAGPWSSDIRATTVESEVGQQIRALGKALTAAAPEQATHAAVVQLAVLFRVIDEYDAKVRWKSEAGGVWKDLGSNLPPRSAWSDRQRQQAVALHDDLQKLLTNDKWPRAAAAPAQITWQQMAPRAELMRRIEPALKEHLAIYTGQEKDPVAAREDLQHQAEIIAVLARAIQANSYEYADEQEYADYAKTLEQQAKAIAAAAAGNQDAATLGQEIKLLRKTCSDCHANFRS